MSISLRVASVCAAALLAAPLLARAQPRPTAPNKARGADLFHNNCIICHGGTGHGNGSGSAAFQPKPANLTDRDKMMKLTDDQMTQVILRGGRSVGASKIMPAWKDVLEEEEVRDVVAFIRADLSH